jgi:hypothetical protein
MAKSNSNIVVKNKTDVKEQKFDASLLQFTPKGSFYNTKNEQMASYDKIIQDFLEFDRTIFVLSTLLPGTEYAKGRMFHKLLSTNKPSKKNVPALIGLNDGLPADYEKKVIDFNLRKGEITKSIKNLIMLSGVRAEDVTTKIIKGKQVTIKKKSKDLYLNRVNNSRTRNIILDFILNRNLNSLEEISVKFKRKCQKLITHALGRNTVNAILKGNEKLMKKYIIRYNKEARPVFNFLFGKDIKTDLEKFPKIAMYFKLKDAAKNNNIKQFKEVVDSKVLPFEVLMGFRNTYKVPIELKEIFEKGRMSEKQETMLETATKKSGGERKVNYENQELYDLWKILYHKVNTQDKENIPEIISAINRKSKKKMEFDFGKLVVIFDSSKSMMGSEERPLHPFLTGLSLISVLNNVQEIIYVGGKKFATGVEDVPSVVVPAGDTELWRALIKAVESKPDTIMVISDGYENTIQGMFETVYEHLKNEGNKFKLLHINPVFAAEVSGVRQLVKDVKPLMIDNYKFLKTNLMFEMLQERKEQIKAILVSEFKKLIPETTGSKTKKVESKKKGDK